MTRTLLTVAFLPIAAFVVCVTVYVVSVRRGSWGMRTELSWEVVASGCSPFTTTIFAEQRLPRYPAGARWLTPALDLVHSLDVRIRRDYWHEDARLYDVPEFSDGPTFDLGAK